MGVPAVMVDEQGNRIPGIVPDGDRDECNCTSPECPPCFCVE
jgi:hypothetical protein